MTIAAAGGVEAIIQGMQAHVGVAAIQENGTAALISLAANGTLWHHLWWRCVVCAARRVATGGFVLLDGVTPSATCTHVKQRRCHGLTPTRATGVVCRGGVLGSGHVGALTEIPVGGRRVGSCQPSDNRGGRRHGGDHSGHAGARGSGRGAGGGRRGAEELGSERCVVAPFVLSMCGSRRVAAGVRALLVCVAPSATCTHVTQRHRRHGRLSPTRATAVACGGGVVGPGNVGALTDLPVGGRRVRSCQPSDHRDGRRCGGDRAGHAGARGRGRDSGAGCWGAYSAHWSASRAQLPTK